jgi:hypothetical protein
MVLGSLVQHKKREIKVMIFIGNDRDWGNIACQIF